ncbi:hypothetical protein HY637_02070 [Candidatus Woesearchaeota archaeon]|nr:hypothetical protein [Candidatus Woesearchaeota archaeon]
MVKQLNKNNKAYFICEECGFAYLGRKTANECKQWCRTHHSCSLEITKYAIKI